MTFRLDTMDKTASAGMTRRQALAALAGFSLAVGGSAALAGRVGAAEAAGAAGSGAAFDPASARDTFTMALPVDPDGLDPHRTAAAATFQITNNIYDPLVRVKADGELTAGLAQTWEVSDDGLELLFHLRSDVRFSNGNPCDAAAVVASLERLQDDACPRKSQYEAYTFEAVDGATVRVTMGSLNVTALTDFAYAWAAVVDVSVADGLANSPVGTGPYTLTEWKPQTSLTLEANPEYWGEAPKTPKVVLRILPELATQVSSLRAGEVDLLWDQGGSQAAALAGDDAFQVLELPGNGVQLMAMNCANGALADERVRQAIVCAVDKDAVIEAAWWGFGSKIGSHFPYGFKGYVDCSDVWPYDPAKARELLADAGYGDGLTLTMRLPESYPVYVDAGLIAADYLKQVGVTCSIEIIDWNTWLEDVYGARNYDLTVVGHTGRLDCITMLARYASTSGENYFNYASDEVDALIAAYNGEPDAEKRAQIAEDIQRTLAQDVPALYIQSPIMVYLASAKLHGFEQYPIDIYELKDVWVEA